MFSFLDWKQHYSSKLEFLFNPGIAFFRLEILKEGCEILLLVFYEEKTLQNFYLLQRVTPNIFVDFANNSYGIYIVYVVNIL